MEKVRKVPSVMVPARIRWAPINITTALTNPISAAADKLMMEVAVRVFRTLSSKPLYTSGKDFFFALFGVITLHDAHSAE